MIRLAVVVLATGSLLALSSGSAWAHTLCVGGGSGCHPTIQSALDAADDGDVIGIAPGKYRGPITITKSVTLAGAGASATVIKGGGPVVTIGEFLATPQPTVAITGVTITGGVTSSSPESQEWTGTDDVIALGGGLKINPAADFSTGATVTLSDSIVTGNRVAPTATLPFGPPCPDGACPFAWAKGGGIDNWGRLTLDDTTVSDNVAAGVASDATGGGIHVFSPGTLTLRDSHVSGNRATASTPNGRFAEGGGINTDPEVDLTISGGSVSDNTARLTSRLPYFVPGEDPLEMNANGGGVHAGDGGSVTILDASLNGNAVSVSDPNGEPVAFDSALHPGDGPLVLRNDTIHRNQLVANVGSSAHVGASGSALDINGPAMVAHVHITSNSTAVSSQSGTAEANGAVYSGNVKSRPAVIEHSTITENTVSASSPGGVALMKGAGLVNDGLLHLDDVLITRNTGQATAPQGSGQGGGIWNGAMFNLPPIRLTLRDTQVTHNELKASAGLEVRGAGMFTSFPVALTNSLIAQNTPDQCFGC